MTDETIKKAISELEVLMNSDGPVEVTPNAKKYLDIAIRMAVMSNVANAMGIPYKFYEEHFAEKVMQILMLMSEATSGEFNPKIQSTKDQATAASAKIKAGGIAVLEIDTSKVLREIADAIDNQREDG